MTNGGSSYTTYPDVTITSNPADTGSGAFAKASLGISSLVFNYPATGQATLGTGANSGTVASIVPLTLGSGYITAPIVTIAAPPVGGIQATVTAVLGTGIRAGQVVGYAITNPGSGYTTVPTVAISIPPNSGVGSSFAVGDLVTLQGNSVSNITSAYAATAIVTSVSITDTTGAITGLSLLNPGKYDYLSSPNGLISLNVIPISGSGTNAIVGAVGFVNAVELVSSGSGYVSTPTVSFSGGNGSGAAAFASLITPTGDVFAGVSGLSTPINIKSGFAGNISFTTTLNLNQDLILDGSSSSLSKITLGGIESGTPSSAHNLTLVAGGSLQFNGTIGGINPLGAIDASSSPVSSVTATLNCLGINAKSFKFVSSGNVTLNCPQVYTGSITSDKSSFLV